MQLEGLVIPISFSTGALVKGVTMITDIIESAVSATFDWAEGMDKLGDVTGMTSDKTAAWAFVAKKAGVEVDTLANATVILAKGLFDSAGKLSTTGKALEDFGVSIKDVNGNVKDQSTLMNDIAAKYQEFGTKTEQVDFLTNLFGRSGARLVDVFDTLAQEGGIDAVSRKVKDLGLAIDPDRYEQFQRNLEELKLAGTGLAIQFTEQLMPTLESLLTWAQQFEGMSPAQILQRLMDQLGSVDLVGLSEKFKNWANNFDWAGLSQTIVDGLSNVDTANGVGIATGKIISNLAEGLNTAITTTDWQSIGEGLSAQLANFFVGLFTGKDLQTFIDDSVNTLSQGIFDGLDLITGWREKTAEWQAGVADSLAGVIMNIIIWCSVTLPAAIRESMGAVKKEFFNAFQAAMQQAIQAINGMVDSVKKAVGDFITAVNSVIGGGIKIAIAVAIPNFEALAAKIAAGMALIKAALGGGGGGGSSLGAPVGSLGSVLSPGMGAGLASVYGLGSVTNKPKGGKAAGGMAGGMTWVGENGPELVNLPNGSYVNNNQSSKRMANQPVQAYIDYDELARTMARVLGQTMQRT